MNLANLANLQAKMDEASCGYKASLVKVDRTVCLEMRHAYFFMNFQMGVSKNTDTPKWMVCNGKPY